jgi:hypothetical protein
MVMNKEEIVLLKWEKGESKQVEISTKGMQYKERKRITTWDNDVKDLRESSLPFL